MKYKTTIQLIANRVPLIVHEWLAESLPVDLTVKAGKSHCMRVLDVTIEALEAKRKAFNAMMEAKGY